jgi:predicted RNase H-like nuclease
MRAVLGIDAAWTEKEPSGVALIADDGSGWRLVEVAASYAGFVGDVGTSGPIARHRGSIPDAQAILTAAKLMIGVHVDLVAIDMPLSTTPITGRRVSDNMISVAYGARHASTHTPSITRPGRLSDIMRAEFDAVGYRLAVTGFSGPALIEVYPHPALIELAAADQRLPYKHSKIAKYWRQETPAVRRQMLLGVWTGIIDLLDTQIQGVRAGLPLPSSDARGYQMKAFEDQLDAIICAWVGACTMDGKAEAYGDGESAIWVPLPQSESPVVSD